MPKSLEVVHSVVISRVVGAWLLLLGDLKSGWCVAALVG